VVSEVFSFDADDITGCSDFPCGIPVEINPASLYQRFGEDLFSGKILRGLVTATAGEGLRSAKTWNQFLMHLGVHSHEDEE